MARLVSAGAGPGAVLAAVLVLAGASCHCSGVKDGAGSPAAPGPASAAPTASVAAAPGSAAPSASAAAALDSAPPRDPAPIEKILDKARRGGGRDVKFVAPDADEARRYSEFVAALARRAAAAPAPTAKALAAEVEPPSGFKVRPVPKRQDLVAIIEAPKHRRGAGAIILRIGPARRVLVQAPHTFYDEGTLPISVTAFERLRARALLVDTVHRYAATQHEAPGDEDEDKGGSASDVAHAAQSHFLSAHEALIDLDPGLVTVQLHGFGDSSVEGVDLVLSGARTALDPAPVAASMRAALPDAKVRTFPDEIQRLGGTTNAQAAACRKRGARFLHMEMSRSLRDKLEKDPAPLLEGLRAAVPEQEGP